MDRTESGATRDSRRPGNDARREAEGPGAPPRGRLLDLWNTLVFTDHSPNPIVVIAAAFGLTGPEGTRVIERGIMTRPLQGISSALDRLAAVTGRRLDGRARRDMVVQWGSACNLNRTYPDVLPTLRRLSTGARRPRLGVLSNTQSFDLECLRRDGLDLMMDTIRLSCHTGLLKPDPAAFLDAAAHLALPPDRILMVGDRPGDDVEGAIRAGMRAVLLDRTGSAPPDVGVQVIRTLADLPPMFSGARPSGGGAP